MIFYAVIESSLTLSTSNQLYFRYMSITGYAAISHLSAFLKDKAVDG
jgi:hypothetical protein